MRRDFFNFYDNHCKTTVGKSCRAIMNTYVKIYDKKTPGQLNCKTHSGQMGYQVTPVKTNATIA